MEDFFCKTQICFGINALEYLGQYSKKRCFIVADPFLVETGKIEAITEYLEKDKYKVFHNVVPDPPLELVVEGIKELQEFQPDILIAIGGGSAIDEAKAMKFFGKKINNGKDMTFIAIPTTSGTGSEVTSFAVITDREKGIKYPLVDRALRPDIAILDPILVKSVPPAIVADTGMDVLTHAIEAYVSTKANIFTDALAEKAVVTVFRYLVRSYECSEDMEAKAMMHYASCAAGIAFDTASLGLNHAIAHNIGGKFHIPHGRTNAILLPHVVEFNGQIQDFQQKNYTIAAKKYAHLSVLSGISGVNIRTGVKNLIHEIQRLQKQLKMPVSFRECGIEQTNYRKEEDAVIIGAQGDACISTNPCNVTREDIVKILKRAW